jgi:hypothetical protein
MVGAVTEARHHRFDNPAGGKRHVKDPAIAAIGDLLDLAGKLVGEADGLVGFRQAREVEAFRPDGEADGIAHHRVTPDRRH